ncbi:MAG: 30S ribosomal protein S16 [Chloroflexi bacterium]|nr:30S ribosomal protein S16 [Chloroflexota bacterium]
MAVKMRLARIGAKKQPTYRVVVADESSKRDGRLVERLGYYDPRTDPPTIVVNQTRVNYWLGVGARPTDSMGQLLRIAGITDQYAKQRTARKSKAAQVEPVAKPAPVETKPTEG